MLYIVATPIGNLEDITLRASRILGEVDFILAEDTRKTGILLKRLGIKKKLVSFYDHTEAKKTSWVIEELKQGRKIALVSNAGTPAISDPGYRLIRECRRNSLEVTSLPGPSSVINALALSSFPHDKFVFLGYLPRKKTQREKLLAKVKDWQVTIIFFESPFRLVESLKALNSIFTNHRVGIFREMTKKFEEIIEAPLDTVIEHFERKKPRGEFVVIVWGHSL